MRNYHGGGFANKEVGMRKFIIGLLVCAIALTAVTTALAAPGWKRFENESMICSISRPGGSEGATCVITTGPLDGWSFIAYSGGFEVTNASDRLVYNKKTTDTTPGPNISWATWSLKNEGVACNKRTYVVSCMIKTGGLVGWAILAAEDEIEITNLDGKTKFHRSVAS